MKKRIMVGIGFVALIAMAAALVAPRVPLSAQGGMKIAIPINGLPAGQVIIAIGRLGSGTLTCAGVQLGHARFGVAVAQGDETHNLLYFQDAVSAGDRFVIVSQASQTTCPDVNGVDYWLYNAGAY